MKNIPIILLLLLFIPFNSSAYRYTYYDHYSKRNLNNESEIVALEVDDKTGKMLVVSSITGEFFYEMDFFERPDNVFLLNNKDYILIKEYVWGEKTTDLILNLYFQGKLVDKIVETRPMKEIFDGGPDSNLYYADTLGKACINYYGKNYFIDETTHEFSLTEKIKAPFEAIYRINDLVVNIKAIDALTINGVPFEEWATNVKGFNEEIHLKISIIVVDGKIKCTVQSLYSKNKIPSNRLTAIEEQIEKAVLADPYYLDRIHSWYFEKSVVLNHEKE